MKKFKELLPNDTVTVFVLPPSLEELQNRITLRGDDASVIKERMEIAKKEIDFYPLYDYSVVNDNLENCINDIKAIITAEKLRSSRKK